MNTSAVGTHPQDTPQGNVSQSKQQTTYRVDAALDTDFYGIFSDISAEDRAFIQRARQFGEEVSEQINEAWDKAEYPLEFARRLGELDLLTDGVTGPGLTPQSPLAAGLVNAEISRIDGSLGTIVAVQGGLALRSIALFGSDQQKADWLVPLAKGRKLGAFALTEPAHGSDSVGLETTARQEGSDWIINGHKKWIGNGSVGDVTVTWARDEQGDIRGFLVPQDTPGYEARTIQGKISLRAIHQAEIVYNNVRVPDAALLPGAKSFKDTSQVLYATRLGVAWSALGHATAVYEAALQYSQQRVQFGKPLAQFQMVQERLTAMLAKLTSIQLHVRELTERDARGQLAPTQASLAKYVATSSAREIAAIGRDMLGGNGILLENHVARHFADIEAVHTYEGTESVQALLIGREITGFSAFTGR